jgi:hypothetical protein
LETVLIGDFKPDESFFRDLRDGNFILVLGSGFSYGVPNKLGTVIPIGDQFVELTKKEFGLNSVDDYEAAAEIWNDKISKSIDANKLLEKFINLFLVDESSFDFTTYSSIFSVPWRNIYTLNFDNVLEILLTRNLRRKYTTYSYPSATIGDGIFNIYHLHGMITPDSTLDKIVFTPTSYLQLEDNENSLYNVLHGDVGTLKKKIIIVGSQFKEKIIRKKFFKGLPNDKSVQIYHFDTKSVLSPVPEYQNRDYTFIKLEDEKGNKGTTLFLKFLQDHRSHIENITISGTDLINDAFIDRVKSAGKASGYGPEDFYLAKQKNDCQWYGVINHWDVERPKYIQIKEAIQRIIRNNKDDDPKIIYHVLGRGGSGKSTLLRRLAIDLSDEDFSVVWIRDDVDEIEKFSQQGLHDFYKYAHKIFLIIIEDWYRIKQLFKNDNAWSFIRRICTIPNVRIILGDRTIDGNISRELFFDRSNTEYKLEVSENNIILTKILNNIPEWKPFSDKLLTTEADFKSSLYLILWTIGRSYQRKIAPKSSVIGNSSALVGHFQSIVLSDLREISRTFPGLAKALYYWSRIYEKTKIFIAYAVFENLANYFNEGKAHIEYLLLPSPIKSLLEIYINKSVGLIKSSGDLELMAFNHDILAEDGLAKVELSEIGTYISYYLPFGDQVKLQMLEVILNSKDDFSSSSFLYYTLSEINKYLLSNENKIRYIKQLYEEGNPGSYLNHCFYANNLFSKSERVKFAIEIIDRFINQEKFQHTTIALALKELINTEAGLSKSKLLLKMFINSSDLFDSVICNALNNLKETSDKGINEAETIIDQYLNGREISYTILSNCLSNLRETEHKGESQAKAILDLYITGRELLHPVVSNSLVTLKEMPDKGKGYAEIIIDDYIAGRDTFQAVICNCLDILLETEEKGEKQAKRLLNHFISGEKINGRFIAPEIISTCLTNLRETENKGSLEAKFIINIYIYGEKDPFISYGVEKSIVCNCLTTLKYSDSKGEEEAKTLLNLYLTDGTIHGRPIAPEIICNCLINLKETEDKGQIQALRLIDQYLEGNKINQEPVNYGIICNCLANLRETPGGGKDEAGKILYRYTIEKKPVYHGIIANSLINLNGTEQGVYYAEIILKGSHWKIQNWSIVFQSLQCYSHLDAPPAFIHNIINEIISQYWKDQKYFHFFNIMKLSFHNIPEWKEASMNIINRFPKGRNRLLITNTLQSYRSHPDVIVDVCEYILNNWRSELTFPITQGKDNKDKKKKPHYGDHIKIALGHPSLINLAKITSSYILKAYEDKSIVIPKYLYEVAYDIVHHDLYPTWSFKSELEEYA